MPYEAKLTKTAKKVYLKLPRPVPSFMRLTSNDIILIVQRLQPELEQARRLCYLVNSEVVLVRNGPDFHNPPLLLAAAG